MLPGCVRRGTAPTAIPTMQQRGWQCLNLQICDCCCVSPHMDKNNGRTVQKIGREEGKIYQKEEFECKSNLGGGGGLKNGKNKKHRRR